MRHRPSPLPVLAAAAFLLAGGPGRAEQPELEMQEFIKAYIGAEFVDASCPGFRENAHEMSEFLRAHELSKEDIGDRYRTFATELRERLQPFVETDRAKVCEFFEDLYGEQGLYPNLVERR